MIRVGMGYDVHRFKDGGDVILGGVKIDYEQDLEAHSDGDVAVSYTHLTLPTSP
jgi:2-C-methyl-D-erythritol 2,4-cyclodiphosphate synthase